MPTNETKGITVKIDAELHAEVKRFIESNNMTMAEFVTLALDDELHPKFQNTEENKVEKMRTLAFQVPESLFQQIKEYLQRNNMTQKDFVIGLIETELDRDLTAREAASREISDAADEDAGPVVSADVDDSAADEPESVETQPGEVEDFPESEEAELFDTGIGYDEPDELSVPESSEEVEAIESEPDHLAEEDDPDEDYGEEPDEDYDEDDPDEEYDDEDPDEDDFDLDEDYDSLETDTFALAMGM